jgi:hypothetical protein
LKGELRRGNEERDQPYYNYVNEHKNVIGSSSVKELLDMKQNNVK